MGIASSAPTTPSRAPPTSAAITVRAPGISTDRDITLRVDDVVLELLVGDVEDHGDDAGLDVRGERDGAHDHRADRGADHRDHVEQGDHHRQRDGVATEADDEQEDQGASPAHVATTNAPET